MGDENSLAGTTKAHKHTSPASDGGFLETTETGVTNMSEASLGYYDSSSILTELPKGTSGQALVMNTAETAPEWASSGGATTNRLQISGATDGSTYTNTTLGDVTGTSSISLSNQAGGSAMIIWCYECECSSSSNIGIAIQVDGVDENFHKNEGHGANAVQVLTGGYATHATDGTTVQERLSVNAGTLTLYNGSAYGVSLTDILEVY